jgi:hypothetical protein
LLILKVRVSAMSTRSPGTIKPATPVMSSTRTVTARMPSSIRRDSVARSFGSVTLETRIGSLASMAASATRSPPESNRRTWRKAPAGRSSFGQGSSLSMPGSISVP